jgi:hypothetical protein
MINLFVFVARLYTWLPKDKVGLPVQEVSNAAMITPHFNLAEFHAALSAIIHLAVLLLEFRRKALGNVALICYKRTEITTD